MPAEDYATKDDIKKLEERLYGHLPPLFENDIGDMGHIRKDISTVQKQQTEILEWKKRVTSIPAKIVMGLMALGVVIAAINGIMNLAGH